MTSLQAFRLFDGQQFTSVYLMTGKDLEFGLKCTKVISTLGIKISAISGIAALPIYESLKSAESFSDTLIVSSEFPWMFSEFIEKTGSKTSLGISIGQDRIIPKSFLGDRSIINLHPSALPYNKGSHQSFWAIMDETLGGGSLHQMTYELDEGPLICKKEFVIPHDMTSSSLQKLQLQTCVSLLRDNIERIMRGESLATMQLGGSKHFKKDIRLKDTLRIDEVISVDELLKLCRATCNKKNGFYIKSHSGTYHVSLNDVFFSPDSDFG